MGYITFEQSGRLLTYKADGIIELSSNDVEEIIAQVNKYRNTQSLWQTQTEVVLCHPELVSEYLKQNLKFLFEILKQIRHNKRIAHTSFMPLNLGR